MNNEELQNKIKEILKISNYFDMVVAIRKFELQYKKSTFYKTTRKPLKEVIREAKVFYLTNLDDAKILLQNFINDLNFDNLKDILDQAGNVYAAENKEITDLVKEFKDIVG